MGGFGCEFRRECFCDGLHQILQQGFTETRFHGEDGRTDEQVEFRCSMTNATTIQCSGTKVLDQTRCG